MERPNSLLFKQWPLTSPFKITKYLKECADKNQNSTNIFIVSTLINWFRLIKQAHVKAIC
jgi:hypothetical protein